MNYLLQQTWLKSTSCILPLCDCSAFSLVFVSVAVDVRNENCAVELKCYVKLSVPTRGHVDVTNAAGR